MKQMKIFFVVVSLISSSYGASSMTNGSRATVFESQTANNFVGGSYHKRIPVERLTLVNLSPPSVNAGCGGIDLHAGSFSALKGSALVDLAKNVSKNVPYFAIQLGLKTISPQIESLTSEILAISRMLNSMNINSCNAASSLVEGVAGRLSAGQYRSCEARLNGDSSQDYASARQACQDKGTRSTNSEKDKKSGLLPEEYNLVWHALKKTNMKDDEIENIMSVSGTIVIKRQNDELAMSYKTSLLSDDQVGIMLAGKAGEVIKRYECQDKDRCLNVRVIDYKMSNGDGIAHRVAALIESIFTKVENETTGEFRGWDQDERNLVE
jgi:conjugative transfer pilus assembly protein TraH